MKALLAIFFVAVSVLAQTGSQIAGLRDSNLRGVSAPSDRVVWVSGSKGTIARTLDAGKTWQRITPPQGAEQFDFRDVEAFSADEAYLMSVGSGKQSRIWKTSDGGKSWRQQYTNSAPEFFLDSLACWNAKHCVALSDPVGGKFLVLMTDDGEHWRELPRDHMPLALVEKRTVNGKEEEVKEGAFAASGTAITVFGPHIWFGTGGPKARIFHSADRGKTWTVADTPIMHGEPSQGVFSIAFRDAKHGVIVGGDYKQPDKTGANAAFTNDGGSTWTLVAGKELPYCSAARIDRQSTHVVAIGLQGVFEIFGDGNTAQVHKVANAPLNAVSADWLVGPNGTAVHRVALAK